MNRWMKEKDYPLIKGVRYIFTKHMRDRVRERFNKECRDCANDTELNRKVIEIVSRAKENKAIHNDTDFISYVYDTYGTELRYKFLQYEDIIFICKQYPEFTNAFIIVTCYRPHRSHFRRGDRLNSNKRG